MSDTKKDGMGNSGDDESGNKIKKPVTTPKKYPFQTTKSKNNSKNKIKQENKSENFIDENKQSNKIETNESETLNKDSPNDVLRTQFINEPIKQDKNISKIVNETKNQSEKDLSTRIDAASSETLDNNKTPINQATGTIFLENEIPALNLIQVSENEEEKKKIRRKDLTEKEIIEICGDENKKGKSHTKLRTPGLDPRFQQQNQTMRCFVMYTDFYRCENILGEGELACQWFKDVFTSICPLDWIRRWDEAREEGRLGWTKGRTQGKFPGDRYGV